MEGAARAGPRRCGSVRRVRVSGLHWVGAAGKRRKVSGPGCWAAGKKKKKEAGLGRCGNKRGKGWAVFWVGLDC